jgi:type VI secretion system (T6SS) VasB/ImpH family protein
MNEHDIISLINELPLDLRVEIVIGDIINSGYHATDLFIRPAGLFQRKFQKDILKAEVIEFKNHQQAVLVNTSRESLYDMLPEVLFHNPPAKNSKVFKSVRDMIDDYKRRVTEEKEARKFFMLYEIEFYRQRIANAMQERHLADAVSYSMDDTEILSYWHLPEFFDNRQKGILFYLFPVFHQIRGALDYMQEVYRLVLKETITIERNDCMQELHYDNTALTLGNMILSSDTIIGKSYHYYYPSITVKAGPLSKEQIYDYLPGGKNIRILKKLNEYFIPLFCEAEIKIETVKNAWVLNSNEKNESRLGYSMYLNVLLR